MPVTMTRPRHSSSRRTARSNRSSRRSTSARMAAASVCEHLRGEREVDGAAVSSCRAGLSTRARPRRSRCSLRISASSRSSRSALAASLFARDGSSWTSMNTASTPAATPADASGSMYSARPAVTPSPAAGQLQAVGDVEHDRVAELAQHRERPHVHDQVVVAEADAALGQEQRVVAFARHLGDHVPHVAGRQELALLDVHRLAGAGRRHEQVGLAREKRRNLQHVDDLRGRGRLRRFVDVGQDRQAGPRLDVGERREAGVEARARMTSRDVRFALSNDALKMTGAPQRAAMSRMAQRHVQGVGRALDDAGAEDEGEGCPPPIVNGPTLTGMHVAILVLPDRSGTRRARDADLRHAATLAVPAAPALPSCGGGPPRRSSQTADAAAAASTGTPGGTARR